MGQRFQYRYLGETPESGDPRGITRRILDSIRECDELRRPEPHVSRNRQYGLSLVTMAVISAFSGIQLPADEWKHEPIQKRQLGLDDFTIDDVAQQVYGTSAFHGQQLVENNLGIKLYELTMEYELTAPQQTKLKLAAQSEAKQFFFDVNQLRRQFLAANGNLIRQQSLKNEAENLRKKRSNLFGTGSFLEKVTVRSVTDEQLVKRDLARLARRKLRHRSNVEGAIRDVERKIVLKTSQHELLVDLLMDEIPPPTTVSDFDETLVKYQFAHLPEPKLKPLFDADQWLAVRQLFDSFQALEPILRERKLIGAAPEEIVIKHNPSADAATPQNNCDQETLLKTDNRNKESK